jgi:hypothetical protein
MAPIFRSRVISLSFILPFAQTFPMKTLLVLFLLTATAAFADSPFPGIKLIMTPEEYARAGLSGLTSDQIGVIDAAIIRHYMRTVAVAANQQAEQISQQTVAEEHKHGLLSHFGMPDISLTQDWRKLPSLKAHCLGWASGNSFKLDNGQVWAGTDPIEMELTNKDIEIQPRPDGEFALVVNGTNTTIRVYRIK